MIGQTLMFLVWSVSWLAAADDPNKHWLDEAAYTESSNWLGSSGFDRSAPVQYSPRVRRQREAGPGHFFVYDTDTEDETGSWGPWEKEGSQSCSRTCGGGVLIETRTCPPGSDCVGPSKRYSSCNINPCPPSRRTFREEQCAKFDSHLFEGKYYSWVPYLKAPRKCELNCMPRGERFYYRHANTVVDGTSCDMNDGLPRTCVAGECRQIGCDGMLGSTATEDKCRVCGGEGSNCNTVSGVLDQTELVMGYNDLLLIPAGATNIKISEVKASNDYLALRNASGHYYINGNWRIDFADDYEVAGTIFRYQRKVRPGMKKGRAKLAAMFAPEELTALGPTSEALYLVILHQDQNLGIEFEYSMPSGAIKETPLGGEKYDWQAGSWADCSVPCGGGLKTRQVLCQSASTKEIMPPNLCDPNVKPLESDSCNSDPCEPKWSTGEWSNCTAIPPGGANDGAGSGDAAAEDLVVEGSGGGTGECSGVIFRNVFCEQIASSTGLSTVVDESLCKEGEKPAAYKTCDDVIEGDETGPKYHVGPWSGCSVICGEGVRTRKVTCYKRNVNGSIEELDEKDCSTVIKPAEEEPCQAGRSCDAFDWVFTDWTTCDGQCGLFKKSRAATCSNADGSPAANDTLCDVQRLPELTGSCSDSESKDGGLDVDDGSGLEPGSGSAEGSGDGSDAKKTEKLSDFVCDFSWFATQWSICSSECLGLKGVQTRKVFCASVDDNNTITLRDDSACDEAKRYSEEEECEGSVECEKGHWFASNFGACSKTCGGGTKKRKVFCLKNGNKTAPDDCDPEKMPLAEEDCNKDPCPEGEEEGSPKCAAYYEDSWIFGEGSGGGNPDEVFTEYGDSIVQDGGSGSGDGSGDGGLSQEDLMKIFDRRCKPEPVNPCVNSTFGCCPDEFNAATGPFDEGCDEFKTCEDTKFGCCQDGVTPSNGTAFLGCPVTNCAASLFGCCPDGENAATGPDDAGCEEAKNCANGKFGCCPDKVTFAQGPHKQGCFECPEEVWMCDSCEKTLYGCCIDQENAATGPNFDGCPDEEGSGAGYSDCSISDHGCCPDGETKAKGPNYKGCKKATPCKDSKFGCCDDIIHPAHGPNKEGCCLTSTFGCCPDNILPAQGPNHEGCSCETTKFGCCPDDVTAAKGMDFEGCGCMASEHKCCPDNFTPAQGPHFANCTCHTYEYGCCPDGKSIARGPGQEGCSCKDTEFGCCPDRVTSAPGPRGEGCGCAASKFGCCPDGVTDADEENFGGCNSTVTISIATPDVCGLPKDRGPSKDFTTRWFFDLEYGGCTKFWYGGDEGNGNNFPDKSSCSEVCVDPVGREACQLPIVPGPCEGYYPRFGYNAETKSCTQFVYGGCLGNNNRFESTQECEAVCTEGGDSSIDLYLVDKCQQPIKSGPCQGNFTRWAYNKETDQCEEFNYGGCKGNLNQFLSQDECVNSCKDKGITARDMCLLPRSPGPCKDKLPKWYFDNAEKRCMPFYYGGCEGNENRFDTQEDCQRFCPAAFLQADVCKQPKEEGPCRDYLERFYFEPTDGTCHKFYYGGCEGNKNNFKTVDSCRSRCSVNFSIPIKEEFKLEFCFLPKSVGSNEGYNGSPQKRWHYDPTDGTCKSFEYLGKKGNGNRFLTRHDCHSACQPSQDFCQLPKVIGPCKNKVQRWFYDKAKDTCHSFDWGGCHGNRNNFETEDFCNSACKRSGPGVIQRQKPAGPLGSLVKVCNLPKDPGTGEDKKPYWYFDSEKSECTAFIYSGREGNANRFETQEQCDRECGLFRDQDVCNVDMDIGPCVGRFYKWYFDRQRRICKEFTFGGCEGNGNRFSSKDECETVCFMHEEPKISGENTTSSHSAICQLDADAGPCDGDLKRWYFDQTRQTCVPFIYSGCAGNRNRFKSFDGCMGFCASDRSQTDGGPGGRPSVSAEPPVSGSTPIPSGDTTLRYPEEAPPSEGDPIVPDYDGESAVPDPERCKRIDERCGQLECPYGKLRYRDDRSGCMACYCNEPCYGHVCPDGKSCSVDLVKDRAGQIHYKAICREPNKDGVCPKLAIKNVECSDDCRNDADCSGDKKCCYNGCGRSCMDPVRDPGELLPSQFDELGQKIDAFDPNAPQIRVQQANVNAPEGSLTVLNVLVSGNPTPDVYWRKGKKDITNVGKYRIIDGGHLQVIGVEPSDAGVYQCFADNGRGIPPQAQVTLFVEKPRQIPASMVDASDEDLIMSLGAPANIRCLVYGFPKPDVTWWRGSKILSLPTNNLEQATDSTSLQIRSLGLRDLGPYTCQAYNGLGPAVSSSTVLKAIGPIAPTGNREDDAYLSFVVSAPRPPGEPYRPPIQTTTTTSSPYDRYDPYGRTTSGAYEPMTTAAPEMRPELGFLDVRIDLQRTRFPLNDEISLPCIVNSYTRPSVQWTKNGYRIPQDQRVMMTRDTNTLVISNSRASDSGTYTCEASNGYRTEKASVSISVENISISSECTDNPYFANCKLIVKAEYCGNKYYAKFCCMSCTLSGQLTTY